jgi:hypothetical protein
MGLDIIEMVVEVESAFAIDIPDAIAPYLSTVGVLYDYVVTHVANAPAGASPGTYSGELWDRYINVLERETGIRRAALLPQARFVQDLRLD